MTARARRLGGRRWLRGWRSAAAFLVYAFVAFFYFGRSVADDPGRELIGRGTDSDIFVWSFAWWAHALRHGLNPIVTHAIWAPGGFNLAWTGTSPGLAFLFVPLTILAGPVTAYNTAAVLMPALAAWTAFLLCRYVTGAIWPSLAGGYLFGFSSYMVAQEEGHLHVTSVFLVPLVALALLGFLDGRLGSRGLAVSLGVMLGAQLWFSTEFAATLALALALSLAIGYALAAGTRRRIRALLWPLGAAYALAAIIAAPLLYYALTDFQSDSVNPPGAYVADLANLVVPTRLTAAGGSWARDLSARFPGNEAEQVAYLGVPTLVILGLYFVGSWRCSTAARFLVVSFAAALLAALGGALRVGGHRVAPLPWGLIDSLPVFNNVITGRLLVYGVLAAAVSVALWAASSAAPLWLRILLPLLAALAVVPDLRVHAWDHDPSRPTFFAAHFYRDCVRPGDNLLVIPFSDYGDSLLWQAESDFHFRMVGGQVSPQIPGGFSTPPLLRLIHDEIKAGDGPAVLALARAKGVSAIVADQYGPQALADALAAIAKPASVGGIDLYALAPGAATSARCTTAGTQPPA